MQLNSVSLMHVSTCDTKLPINWLIYVTLNNQSIINAINQQMHQQNTALSIVTYEASIVMWLWLVLFNSKLQSKLKSQIKCVVIFNCILLACFMGIAMQMSL